MKEQDAIVGRLIGGKYRILDYIGGGGFGAVYRAEQLPVGRAVALKVIHEKVRHEDELRIRFLREARSVARLKSPHIVTLFDYGEEDDGVLYMVFEFVEGQTLKQILIQEQQIPLSLAAQYAIQMLEGLSVAHEKGIVHRDLKPANIIIASGAWGFEQARILDFGVAKMLENDLNDPSEESTRRGLVLGTPHYMSPEQVRTKGIDARADIYAMGALLFTMVSGRPPFTGETTFDILQKHVQHSVEGPLAKLDAPDAFKAVLRCALHKDPSQRYDNAREMAEALVAFAGPPERSSRKPSDTEPETDALSNLTPGAVFKSQSRGTSVGQEVPGRNRVRVWTVLFILAAGILALGMSRGWFSEQDSKFTKGTQNRSAKKDSPRPPNIPAPPRGTVATKAVAPPSTKQQDSAMPPAGDASARTDAGHRIRALATAEARPKGMGSPDTGPAKPASKPPRSGTLRKRRTPKLKEPPESARPTGEKPRAEKPSKGSLRLEEF